MRKKLLITIIAAVLLIPCILTACTMPFLTPVGSPASRDYNLTGFTEVSAASGFDTEIIRVDTYKVTVITNENLFRYLDVCVSGTTLKLQAKPLSIQGFHVLKAEITMPELTGLTLSSGAQGNVSGFASANDFNASLSSGSSLEMDIQTGKATFDISSGSNAKGRLKAGDTSIRLSSGSQLKFDGTAGNLAVTASSGSQSTLSALAVNNADIRLSGGSQAEVNASGIMDINLSSGSSLRYSGSPRLGNVEVSGGSDIRQG